MVKCYDLMILKYFEYKLKRIQNFFRVAEIGGEGLNLKFRPQRESNFEKMLFLSHEMYIFWNLGFKCLKSH